MSIKQTSLVWEFFTENGDWVICTKCPKAYKHQALQAVPPTSVEVECVFSAGELFLTKLHSNMSDMSLDKLIFLKLFFALKNEHIF